MDKKKIPPIEIIEMFLVKSNWRKTFVGEIIREKTEDGEICRGTVVVNEGRIWSTAKSDEELGFFLDEICIMKLDYNLHSNAGVSTKISGFEFFSN